MLYPSAMLFKLDTKKKIVTSMIQFDRGTTDGFNLGPYLPQVA